MMRRYTHSSIARRLLSRSSSNLGASQTLKVDRSGLIQFGDKWPTQEEIDKVAQFKEPLSPLGKILRDTIKMRGPLSVHDYMSQALHHEKYGYYQQKKEKIGTGGDFITSPEISQLFGEMVGIWCLATWESMGKPTAINLVEMGPGNGTLMKDVLHIVKNFPTFQAALQVSLVEVSPAMRQLQREALECIDSKDSSDVSSQEPDLPLHNEWSEQTEAACMQGTTPGGISISWYNYLKHVPPGPSLYVGHEILDAFPVHQFSKTAEGGRWRETMVDVDFSEETPFHFRFVKTPTITPALRIFFNKTFTGISDRPLSSPAEVTEKGELDAKEDGREKGENTNKEKKGDTALDTKNLEGLELCPLAFSTVEEIAQNVVKHKGAALLIDYGEHFPQEDTLRGFQQHSGQHVLSAPGTVDITADVNFAACAQVAREQGAAVQGSIAQGQFLFNMGLVTRVEQVLDADSTTDEQAQTLVQATEKILTGTMGTKFKAIAITNEGLTTPGFNTE